MSDVILNCNKFKLDAPGLAHHVLLCNTNEWWTNISRVLHHAYFASWSNRDEVLPTRGGDLGQRDITIFKTSVLSLVLHNITYSTLSNTCWYIKTNFQLDDKTTLHQVWRISIKTCKYTSMSEIHVKVLGSSAQPLSRTSRELTYWFVSIPLFLMGQYHVTYR